jgi:hypothetical protein
VAPPVARSALTVRRRVVSGRDYLLLSQLAPRVQLRLERPKRSDRDVLVCVPGTYTSPEGTVEGAVVLEGKLVRPNPMPWEALLVIESSAPQVRWQRSRLGAQELAGLAGRKASVVQGHLLVGGGKVRPLKPSPALRRRALTVASSGGFAIVESTVAVELGVFAADLVAMGVFAAMNLDMGRWSEGWYRDPGSGKLQTLGEDFRATDKQTNWIVLLAQ